MGQSPRDSEEQSVAALVLCLSLCLQPPTPLSQTSTVSTMASARSLGSCSHFSHKEKIL